MKKILTGFFCLGIFVSGLAQITVVAPISGATIGNCSTFGINYSCPTYMASPTADLINASSTVVASWYVYNGGTTNVSLGNVAAGIYSLHIYDKYSPSNTKTISSITVAAPASPTGLTTSLTGSSVFEISWSGAGASWIIEVATDAGFLSKVSGYTGLSVSGSAPAGYYITSNINPATQYWYRISTVSGGGCISAPAVGPVVLTAPAAPVLQSATSTTSSSFNANWLASATATGYTLDISTSSSFVAGYSLSGYPKAVGNILTYNISGLTGCTTYYYRVFATNPNSSVASSTGTYQPILPAPSAPVAAAATAIGSYAATASWTSVINTSYYTITTTPTSTGTSPTAGLSEVMTGLSPYTSYSYYVNAHNCGGTSVNSNSVSFKTLLAPPVLSFDGYEDNGDCETYTTEITWPSVTGAAHYDVYLGSTFITSTSGLAYGGSDFAYNSDYPFKVRAVDASSIAGPFSNIIDFGTPTPGDCFGARMQAKDTKNYKKIGGVSSGTSIYPNPATDILKITVPFNAITDVTDQAILADTKAKKPASFRLTISNSTGQQVRRMEYDNNHADIDVRDLPRGMYFVSIEYGSESVKRTIYLK